MIVQKEQFRDSETTYYRNVHPTVAVLRREGIFYSVVVGSR